MALLLTVISMSAAFIARKRPASAWLAPAVAGLNVVVLLAWIGRHDPGNAPWEIAGLVAALAAVFHVFFEFRAPAEPPGRATAIAAAVASLRIARSSSCARHGPTAHRGPE